MAIRRYARTSTFGLGFRFGTSFAIPVIRKNMADGNIRFDEMILQEAERLDILAGKFYGDGKLWWVIAAASNIGWVPQVPPGTLIKIPNIQDISKFVG
jgi:hypothetical protein